MDLLKVLYFSTFVITFAVLNTLIYKLSLYLYNRYLYRHRVSSEREQPVVVIHINPTSAPSIDEENDMKARVVENPDNTVCVAV